MISYGEAASATVNPSMMCRETWLGNDHPRLVGDILSAVPSLSCGRSSLLIDQTREPRWLARVLDFDVETFVFWPAYGSPFLSITRTVTTIGYDSSCDATLKALVNL